MEPPSSTAGEVARVSDDPELRTVAGLLEDDCARRILELTSVEARSTGELDDRIDASRQTIYRRLEALQDADLVESGTRPRADGHHDEVYVATLDRLTVRLRDGSFECELNREETDAADELTRLWRNF